MDAQLNTAAALAGVRAKNALYFTDRASNHGLDSTDSEPKGFISTVIRVSQLEENDGSVFTWD